MHSGSERSEIAKAYKTEAYLDNAATTQVYPEVCDLMVKLMREDFGNPSSMHRMGVKAEQYLRSARESIAGMNETPRDGQKH